jgi:hypothetical protein
MSKPTKLKYNGRLSCLLGRCRILEMRGTRPLLSPICRKGIMGYAPGDLFEYNGFVKVTKENQPNPIGVSGTAVLGVVTVVIT